MAQMTKLGRRKLGEILVQEGLLKEDQIQEALKRQRGTGEFFAEACVQLSYVTEMDIARTLVKQFGLPFINAAAYRIPKDAAGSIPPEFMLLNQVVVLDRIGKTLLVAVSGLPSGEVFDKLEKVSGCQIFLYVSTAAQVREALAKVMPQNGKAAPAKK
jgi:hypothetical protein